LGLSPGTQQKTPDAAPKLHDPGFAPEAAKLVADIYDRWKVKLPPQQETG
jgi:hypothetical protein